MDASTGQRQSVELGGKHSTEGRIEYGRDRENGGNNETESSRKFQPAEHGVRPGDEAREISLSHVEEPPIKKDEIVTKPSDRIADAYNHKPLNPFMRWIAPVVDRVRELGRTPEEKKISNYAADKGVAALTEETRLKGQLLEPLLQKLGRLNLSHDERVMLRSYAYDMNHYGRSPLQAKIESSPRYRYAMQTIAAPLVEVHNIQRALNMDIGGRKAIDKPNYFPDMPSHIAIKEVTERGTSPKAQKLKQDLYSFWFKKASLEDKGKVEEWVRDYIDAIGNRGGAGDNTKFQALRKAEGLGLPKSWVDPDIVNTTTRYFNRASKDLAFFKHIENDPHMRAILNIPDKDGSKLDNIPSLPDGTPITNENNPIGGNVKKDLLDSFHRSMTDADALVQSGSRAVVSGMLGALTGAKYLVESPFIDLPYLHVSDIPKIVTSIKDFNKAWKKSFEYGVNNTNVNKLMYGAESVNQIADQLNWMSDLFTKFSGRALIENVNRAKELALGYNVAKSMLNSPPSDKTAARFIRLFGAHVEGGAEQYRGLGNKIPDNVLWEMGAQFVERGQGTYGPRDLPGFASTSKFAPLLALQKWSIARFNNEYKDVYLPLVVEHDPLPLIKRTLGALLGGAAMASLIQTMTGRKQQAPTIQEAAEAKNNEQKIYAVMSTLSMGDMFGIAGDMVGNAFDEMEGHKASNLFAFPSVDYASNTVGPMVMNYVRSLNQGVDIVDASTTFARDLGYSTFQAYRLIADHLDKNRMEQIETSNEKRDFSVYKRLQGYPVQDQQAAEGSPFTNPAVARLHATKDLDQAKIEAQKAVEEAIKTSGGKVDVAVNALNNALKENEDVVPNPSTVEKVQLLYGYRDWLIKTQGKDYWEKFAKKFLDDQQIGVEKRRIVFQELSRQSPQLAAAFKELVEQ